ncbi:MAG: CbtB-domain containing protein [Acidimicrobiia bacterium]|nr:CbtB-domain containing protein [Acidimicrobiia bacterium]
MAAVAIPESVSEAIGRSGILHEVFHDGRHLIGVPCH